MPTQVASLFGVLDLQDNMTPALRDAEGTLSRFGGGLQSAGRRVTSLGGQFSLMTAPLAALGMAGVNTAASFEDVMTQLATFGGLAGDELERVEQAALDMGAATMFSAQDAASAMLELVKAGMDTSTAMDVAADALNLAAVGAMDMTTATGIVSMTMAQFNMEASQAGDIVQTLGAAASASTADVQELADGLANVGPVASQFGMDLTETAATLAVFSDAGIKGAEAGTALKSLLLNLSSDRAAGAFDELGVSLYDAEGAMRDFDTVIDELGIALADLPVEEQNRLMLELGGSYGITGLAALIAAGGTDSMVDAMAGAPDAAALATGAMDTFNGRLDSLKGSIETLMIQAFTPFMENVLKPLISQLTDAANKVTDFATANPELMSSIVGVGAALLLVGPALMLGGTLLSAIGTAATVVGGALAVLTSPIVLVAGAFVGLLAAGGTLDDALGVISKSLSGMVDGFQLVADGISKIFATGDPAAGFEAIGGGLAIITDNLLAIPETILNNLVQAFENLTGIDLGGLDAIGTALRGIADAFAGLGAIDLTSVATGIQTQVATAMEGVNGITLDFGGLSTLLTDHLDEAISIGMTALAAIIGGPAGIGIGIARLLVAAVENDFMGIGTLLTQSGVLPAVQEAADSLLDSVSAIFGQALDGGGISVDTSFLEQIGSDIQLAIGGIVALVNELVSNNIAPGLAALADGIGGFVTALSGTETGGLYNVIRPILGIIGALAGAVVKIAGIGLEGVLTAVGNALPAFGEALSSLITAVSRVGEGDFSGALSAFGDAIGGIVNTFAAIPAGFADVILGEIERFSGIELPSVDEGINALVDGLSLAGTAVMLVFDGIKRSLGTFFLEVQLQIVSWVGTFRQTILDATGGTVDIAPNLVFDMTNTIFEIDEMRAADAVSTAINASLANGTPLDLTQLIDTGTDTFGAAFSLGNLLNNENVIEDMSVQGRMAIQSALDRAAAGGDAGAYQALVPVAGELQIPVPELQTQIQDITNTAATSQVYTANIGVNLTLSPLGVNMDAVSSAAQAALAGAGGGRAPAGLSTTGRAPHGVSGGLVTSTGLIEAHAGERLLTASDTRAYDNGGGGGGMTVNLTAYGSSPYDILDMVERAARDRGQ